MKWIDLPPVWLAAFILLVWATGELLPEDGVLGGPVLLPGVFLVGVGIGAMVLAAVQMLRHRTTIIPHRDADSLVSTGIFSVSRNPIYLGDVLVLAGCGLYFVGIAALAIVPIFMQLITARFIRPEEDRLSATFGPEFSHYKQATRRWL